VSWKRHFRVIRTTQQTPQPVVDRFSGGSGTSANFASYLPLVYAGHPNRIQRYYQFDDMDRDSDINAALDTIADFSTLSEEHSDEPFEFKYSGEPNESETKILKTMMTKWVKMNNFNSRLWYMFRDTLKNGDAFFLRDPETQEWLWLDHFMVEMVKVDDTMGKKPEEYLIRGLDYNKQTKFGSKQADPNQYRTPYGTSNIGASRISSSSASSAPAAFSLAGTASDPRQRHMLGPFSQEVSVVDAEHVVHLSLSIGNDINWPFGTSILEPIFKVFKQKELLEDSIIIYRVQRAPERRIFYIDVGTMPPERAKRHIEMIKNDIHQRRIPNRTGTGGNILDAAYNPLCLDLGTRIPLLDGRTLALSELIIEYQAGKENWVYSCDPVTGEIMPGPITWAGETRKDAEVIKITFDNGKTLTCTPDHKIPVLGRGFVEARYLTTDDSLIAFNTREKNIDRKLANERTYTQVFDHHSKSWQYVHRMVGEFFRSIDKHQQFIFLSEHADSVKNIIHHIDYDRYNNNPQNLTYMNKNDHMAYHSFERKNYWENLTADEDHARLGANIGRGLKKYYAKMTQDEKVRYSEMSLRRNKWIAEKRKNDPSGFAEWRRKVGKGRAQYLKDNPEIKAVNDARLRMVCKVIQNQKFQSTHKMLAIIAHIVKEHGTNRIETAKLLQQHDEFLAEIRAANPIIEGIKSNLNFNEITPPRLDKVIADFGYKNWKDFAKKAKVFNHRIVKIECVGRMDVGTITVDGDEQYHSHHTFAIDAGIFVKNSINDDYFFAQSSDGRGSKVETLPGGEQTGEITDLMFFSRKLARGLRVPTSYLNLGEDDASGGVTFNDGKLGAAMIQEFRFTKYCIRWQSLLAPTFDKEFKRFLIKNGIEMDWSLFELRFTPPQSFTRYRQIELDSQRVQVYQGVSENKHLAERYKLKRFLGLTDDEMLENEKLWAEENSDKLKKKTGSTPAESGMAADGLSSVGVRPMGDDMSGEMPPEMPPEGGEMGPDGAPVAGAAAPPMGGAAGGAPPPAQ
jgi:intein/homing endonuclease